MIACFVFCDHVTDLADLKISIFLHLFFSKLYDSLAGNSDYLIWQGYISHKSSITQSYQSNLIQSKGGGGERERAIEC